MEESINTWHLSGQIHTKDHNGRNAHVHNPCSVLQLSHT